MQKKIKINKLYETTIKLFTKTKKQFKQNHYVVVYQVNALGWWTHYCPCLIVGNALGGSFARFRLEGGLLFWF